MRKLLVALLALAVLAVLFLNFVWPSVAPMMGSNPGVVFTANDSTSGTIGNVEVDFATPILRESRAKRDLVVLEQDVEVSSTVSSVPANIDLFKKSTTVHSFGTGVYTVDMAALTSSSVETNDQTRTVTVRIPHACLQYVTEDLDRTEFEATERGLLAFGDLVLTQEQQAALKQTIADQMRTELTREDRYDDADAAAIDAAYDLFEPIVKKVDEAWRLSVEFDDATANRDLTSE